jgi:putative endonuclease
MLLSNHKDKFISYVGYTNDLKKRLSLHNSSKGAKFTKGKKWVIIYQKKYISKSKALKDEYKLKKDYKFRNKIKNNFIKNEKNIYNTSL